MPNPIPIYLADQAQIQQAHADSQLWLQATGFKGDPGTFCLVPDSSGGLGKVIVSKPDPLDTWALGHLPQMLPPHQYQLADSFSPEVATALWLGWRLGQYSFQTYRGRMPSPTAELVPPPGADQSYVEAAVKATTLVRDLVNTPAGDMGPAQLEAAAQTLADTYAADLQVIRGDALLQQNYPLIHAVGRANIQEPRLLELRWGNPTAPPVTLVGKGVCFDTGGLNIKNAAGMKLMKKDMGGAAHALGVATMVMQCQLPVRLRVLIPAVENSIDGSALHPLDVVPSRKGITVEVGNTDAEGRLILADALWDAVSAEPHPTLLVDFATLTGAARIALGTELPGCFCNHPATAQALLTAGKDMDDPLWQLPLHLPYRTLLDSKVADISNIANQSYGGSITAALFLQEFVLSDIPWVHIDLMAWNIRALPGRPEGGEAMGMRAVFELIRRQVQP